MNYLDSFSLKGKVAVVTGALGILGKHFCHGLAQAGANVVAIDLDKDAVEDFASDLIKQYQGQEALGLKCDVSSASDVENAFLQIIDKFGALDILHNNAAASKSDEQGEAFFESFEEYSLEEWKRVMSVNLDGMFLVAQAASKQMIKRGKGGSIVQTASIYGIMGPDQRIYEGSRYMNRQINTPAVYSASKGGVVALTRYLATYLAPYNIRVNTLTPGGVRSGQNDAFVKAYSNRIPLGRMAEGYEMVGALLFLASDASSYVTGQNIIVDGGLNAW